MKHEMEKQMKSFVLATLLTLSTFGTAFANTLMGCEVVKAENGNYFVKADTACIFTVDATARSFPEPADATARSFPETVDATARSFPEDK